MWLESVYSFCPVNPSIKICHLCVPFVRNGIKRFTDETGIAVMEFEVTNEAQRQQAMEKMIQRGATLVLGVGFAQADAIDKVAAANPDKMFSIIDVNWLDRPNLRHIFPIISVKGV